MWRATVAPIAGYPNIGVGTSEAMDGGVQDFDAIKLLKFAVS